MVVSVRQPYPAWLIRGRDNTTALDVYVDGTAATPSTATYTLYDESGSALVSAAAATITSGRAAYTVSAATLPSSRALSWEWAESWALTVGGESHTIRRPAWHVLGQPYPGLTLQGLERFQPIIGQVARAQQDPTFNLTIAEAWDYLVRRLIEMGQRPPRVLNGDGLFDWHRFLTLWMVFQAAGPDYRELATDYWGLARDAQKTVRMTLDFNDDGRPDEDEEGQGAEPVLVLTSRRLAGSRGRV